MSSPRIRSAIARDLPSSALVAARIRRSLAAGLLRSAGFACVILLGGCNPTRTQVADAAADGPPDRLPGGEDASDTDRSDRNDIDGPSHDTIADSGPTAPPCTVVPPTSCPEPAPRYTDIAPIVGERCVPCHSGVPGGPWPLNSYRHLVDWHDTIPDVLRTCLMPPPDSGRTMTDDERVAILTWLLCGYLE